MCPALSHSPISSCRELPAGGSRPRVVRGHQARSAPGEGWLYLAAVQDLFSRRIVGWSMAGAHAPRARHRRAHDGGEGPAARERGRFITPTTAGQFIGLTFGQSCHDAGIAQSMGAVGTCFDNAVAETFFATLTKERLLRGAPADGWATRAQLRSAILKTGGFQQLLRQQPPDSTKPGGGGSPLRLGRAWLGTQSARPPDARRA